ncbi:unnamed protein product, partial [Amoebophrya sp. A120]
CAGILGFVRFLRGWYVVVLTKKKKLGTLGHHEVFEVERVELVPIADQNLIQEEQFFQFEQADLAEEQKWVERWMSVLKSGNFFFSYSYELSRSVQQNQADRLAESDPFYADPEFFRFLVVHPCRRSCSFYSTSLGTPDRPEWRTFCLTICHGTFAQQILSSYSQQLEITLVSRRSTRFAGTRYRKRGMNAHGHCGNEVESEQILCHPGIRSILSFVQLRASVPLFWGQESTAMAFKPPIVYPKEDIDLQATRRHLGDLLSRYGSPLVVLNLMRNSAGTDEQTLSAKMKTCLEKLAAEIVANDASGLLQVVYHHLDLKAAAKLDLNYAAGTAAVDRSIQKQRFNRLVCETAEAMVDKVGFYHQTRSSVKSVQSGAVRVNCVDCLDRTNVLLFFLGLEAFERQLKSLGAVPTLSAEHQATTFPRQYSKGSTAPSPNRTGAYRRQSSLELDGHVAQLLGELYDTSGDCLSMQYAGSVAHKKYASSSGGKELLTSIQRQYQTSFQDAEKQLAINLFLGI